MPARRQLHQSSRRVDTGQLVNKFGSHNEHDTHGDARQRRDDDQRLAALLIEGGLTDANVHAAPPGSDDQYVSDDGEWTESLGRALRRHQMFPSQAFAAKTRHGLRYTVFAGEHGIDTVRQVRVAAPVCSVPLDTLRRVHADTSRRVNERLRYGIARYAPSIAIDLIAAHIQRDGDDGRVYLHYHLVGRGGTPEEWAALESYWVGGTGRPETGWLWWTAEDEDRLNRHPAALVQYAAAGLAEELDDEWTPEELVELWRQTRGVALVRAVGEYRRWLGKLDADGMTVRRHPEYGVAEIVPRRPAVRIQRLREHLFANVGFSVLRRVIHDFGDGVFREAWHVRGRPGVTAAEIRTVYRDAPEASTEGTAYPGIPRSPTVVQPPPPPDPPPRRPWITAPELEEIPW
ncbi:hypothetical protein [Roseomonas genomospecies 6]|uniref:Uncharacterized protein n=1 Tax=Roseomonas genomospecies 6 TaxID=214106 RepID=A0A9W7NLB9_9PROT|nr:hypothetical protein [Roseomonas genomospecies 6]KAA0682218.1 hypothetical protein DS843_06640 [Roseomonas genomospecies 6]